LAARSDGLVNMIGQAEDYFARAVEIDPSFADAWAALALARAGQVGFEQGDGQETMAARARAAARRALLLDPGSVEAQTALAFVPSPFGRWAEMQGDCRRLLQLPRKTRHAEWLLRARLAHSLGEVGRCREALAEFRRVAAVYPEHPYSNVGLTQALWNAGHAQAAEAESDRGLRQFSRHPDVWFMRMALLTYGSRPERAVAFGNDRSKWPFREGGEGLIFRRLKTAEALAFLKPETIEEAVRLHRNSILGNRAEVPAAARFFVALGRFEEALDYLWSYYRNRGRYADPARPQPGPLTRYAVSDLFWPPMAPLWSDPRFAELTEEIGLGAYWRETGSRPDFRNPAPA
jgi:Tfp pilus assembly protein PilF